MAMVGGTGKSGRVAEGFVRKSSAVRRGTPGMMNANPRARRKSAMDQKRNATGPFPFTNKGPYSKMA